MMGLDFGQLQRAKADPKAVVRFAAQSASFTVTETGDTWHISVPIGSLRKQNVTVQFGGTDPSGNAIVSIMSICGPMNEKNAPVLLRFNSKLVNGAFAIEEVEGVEMIVLKSNLLADTINNIEAGRVLSAIAFQADKVEEQLSGGDVH